MRTKLLTDRSTLRAAVTSRAWSSGVSRTVMRISLVVIAGSMSDVCRPCQHPEESLPTARGPAAEFAHGTAEGIAESPPPERHSAQLVGSQLEPIPENESGGTGPSLACSAYGPGRSLGSAGAALPQSGGYRVIRASQWASPPFSASCTSTDTGNIASNHRIALAGWRTESEGSSTPNGSQRTLV